ncbi:MAG: S9 family peptidase [Paludibacter sp.]|nr:S9 family peptidase [Paludibacter sp.]
MKNFFLSFILLYFSSLTFSQNLLYDITDGKFRANMSEVPTSLQDGQSYVLLVDNQRIVQYDYKTGKEIATFLDLKDIKNLPFTTIQGFQMSPDEKKILIYTKRKMIFRRSFSADYYIYNIARKEIIPLSEKGAQQVPLFSPDSRYIAFARDNNLYINKLDYNTEIAITTSGISGKIINGVADWVYEEEFARTRYFEWSPDSKLLAFVQFDESAVPEFSYVLYNSANAKRNNLTLYPEVVKFKYPVAGQPNSKVKVCVYDDFYKQTKTMQIANANDSDFYVPRIKWTKDPEKLAIFKLNRTQNQLIMYVANAKSTVSKNVFEQNDKSYVDYSNIDYTYFTPDNQYFITVTEKDGWRQAYRYFLSGTLDRQLTKGTWDITDVYGYDAKNGLLYFQAAAVSPLQREIYSVDNKGIIKCLTTEKGFHSAIFNADFSLFVDNYSNSQTPNIFSLKNNNGKTVRTIEDNNTIAKDFNALNLPKKEFFTFKTSENVELNGWIVKPQNIENSKQYPLILVQYSGPNSQEVLDRWNIDWEYYLASEGFVVACVDGRGTGARGAEFRKCTYMNLGEIETKDQIETAQYFGNQTFIDKNRIGIWGWSFGGFISLYAMTTGEQQIFKAGIAVAPVTDWRFYDSSYTERFMRTPQENFTGYDNNSPLLNADKLKGTLLIIGGSADDNVHPQNMMTFVSRLVEAGVQFEMQIYTDKNHSILGKQTRRHLYTRMSDFFKKNL